MSALKRLAIAYLLFTPFAVEAATLTASDCSQVAVAAKVTAAVDGDTVQVPAGTCTWTSTVGISGKSITLQGAGIGATVIIDGTNPKAPLIQWSAKSSGITRLTGFTFDGGSTGQGTGPEIGMITIYGSTPNFRMDHCKVLVKVWGFRGMFFHDNIRGVLDHISCEIYTMAQCINIGHETWNDISDGGCYGSCGGQSWVDPSSIGTANALYIEDSTFEDKNLGCPSCMTSTGAHDSEYGSRMVYRKNTYTNTFIGNHGLETGGRSRSARQWEYYNNNFIYDNGVFFDGAMASRGGTGMVFNNTSQISPGAGFNTMMNMSTYRANAIDGNTFYYAFGFCGAKPVTSITTSGTTATATTPGNGHGINSGVAYVEISGASPAGYNGIFWAVPVDSTRFTYTVSGSLGPASGNITHRSPFDQNSDSIGYRCLDQIGAGSGNVLLTGNPPTWGTMSPIGWTNQVSEPAYIFNNLKTGSLSDPQLRGSGNVGDIIVANRDYYSQNTSFNGSSGVGVGPLGSRPGSCTTGVAYWATDQGEWDASNGSTPDGQLYKCTAPNTWSLYYKPFTYPHPLAAGTPAATNALITCDGQLVACTVAAGATAAISWQGNTGATGCNVTLNGGTVGTGLSGAISPTLTQTSTFTLTCSGGSGTRTASVLATVTQPKFIIGNRVRVVPEGALARSSPGFGTNGSGDNILGSHTSGELGTVIGGPQSADGWIWWNVNYDSGADGWTTEPNIDVYTAVANSTCDVNADGATNVSDVQGVVNQALGVAACVADINLDRLCNVIDVQRVVNAALGGACVSP